MQFFEFRIYQVYPNISFLKNRYDMDDMPVDMTVTFSQKMTL